MKKSIITMLLVSAVTLSTTAFATPDWSDAERPARLCVLIQRETAPQNATEE